MSNVRLVLLLLSVLGAALLAAWFIGEDDPATSGDGSDPSVDAQADLPPATLIVFPSSNGRLLHAPCTIVPGDGLASYSTVLNVARQSGDHVVAVMMGDVCNLAGPLGGNATSLLVTDFLPRIGVNVLVAGPGELQFGTGYVAQELRQVSSMDILCGNATDAAGQTILKGWSVRTTVDGEGRPGRTFLFVGVAGLSIADDLALAESDIQLGDPVETARTALAAGLERAENMERAPDTRVLLVHGTEEEAARILAAVPGFDLAAVADGPAHPQRPHRMEGRVPILYPGADGRFLYWCGVSGASPPTLGPGVSRLGRDLLTRGDRSRRVLQEYVASLGATALAYSMDKLDVRPQHPDGEYAGRAACATCHAEAAERHARSTHGTPAARWQEGGAEASPQCVVCHTTGPNWNTGYRGPGDDSSLRSIDCEACHGPGADHVAAPGPGYGAVEWETCTSCHTPENSPGFDAAARWSDVGHGPR